MQWILMHGLAGGLFGFVALFLLAVLGWQPICLGGYSGWCSRPTEPTGAWLACLGASLVPTLFVWLSRDLAADALPLRRPELLATVSAQALMISLSLVTGLVVFSGDPRVFEGLLFTPARLGSASAQAFVTLLGASFVACAAWRTAGPPERPLRRTRWDRATWMVAGASAPLTAGALLSRHSALAVF